MMDEDKLINVRQPAIPLTGIILGFTLSIATNRLPKAFTTGRITKALTALSLCIHIPLFIIVLFRIMNINYPKDNAEQYYRKTLILFITALSLYFFLIVLIMYESTIINR